MIQSSKQPQIRVLVIGYGNPHRQDDRVGHEIAGEIETWAAEQNIDGIRVITAYQLDLDMVEDAVNAETVIFIDAHTPDFSEDISFNEVTPGNSAGFTTHAFTAGDIISLCGSLYNTAPEAFILSVPGYAFDMEDTISHRTKELLPQAVSLLKTRINEIITPI
jgi:hydrogenase maturation protease